MSEKETNKLIKHLWDMIDELTKNEEKLKIELAKEKEKNKELEEEIENWKFTQKYVEDNYIYKNEIKQMLDKFNNCEYVYTQDFIRDLEELLEEK